MTCYKIIITSFLLECRSRVKPAACSVTVSKRKEEMTTKQTKKPQSVHIYRILSGLLNEYHNFRLSYYLFSRQCRDVRNKSLHKSTPCCFQVQLLSSCQLLLQVVREQFFSLADNSRRFL